MTDPQNLTEKELLIEVNRQLAKQNDLLEQLLTDAADERELVTCTICNAEVPADEREQHLKSHNAPPEMDPDGMFTSGES